MPILMICGDYSEDYEVMMPFQALLVVGHQVHAVCQAKRRASRSQPPFMISRAADLQRKARPQLPLNATFTDIRPEPYDALVILHEEAADFEGGRGLGFYMGAGHRCED